MECCSLWGHKESDMTWQRRTTKHANNPRKREYKHMKETAFRGNRSYARKIKKAKQSVLSLERK